jgi:NADP-reducing hydrogenase subunit HndB
MAKLTISDLDKIKDRVRQAAHLSAGGDRRARIIVHMGTCGIASGAKEIMKELQKIIAEKGISGVELTSSGCAGMCGEEPMITVEMPEEPAVKYLKLTAETTRRIFEEHIENGKIVEKLALGMGPERTF